MAAENQTASLESAANLRRQKREWIAERCGKVLMLLIVLAAILGLLGPGPLTWSTQVSSDQSIHAEHHRVQRYQAPAELVIQVASKEEQASTAQLGLSRSLIDQVTIESIIPRPQTVTSHGDQLLYSFSRATGADELRVVIRYQNNDFGWCKYSVTSLEGQTLALSHFVCP